MQHIEMFLRMVPWMHISAAHAGLLAERNICRALDSDLVHGDNIQSVCIVLPTWVDPN